MSGVILTKLLEPFCYVQNYAVSQGFKLKPSPSGKENPKPKKEKVTDFCVYYVLLLNLLLTLTRAPNDFRETGSFFQISLWCL